MNWMIFSWRENRAVYTEMMKRSDWYQFASEPQRYEAYSGYRQEANDKLRDLLPGKNDPAGLAFLVGGILGFRLCAGREEMVKTAAEVFLLQQFYTVNFYGCKAMAFFCQR